MSLLWSFEGRIGRAGFWLGVLCMILLAMAIGIRQRFSGCSNDRCLRTFADQPCIRGDIRYWQHCNPLRATGDLREALPRPGQSGWWALIAFVPVIGSLWISINSACFPAILALTPTGRPVLKGAFASAVTYFKARAVLASRPTRSVP